MGDYRFVRLFAFAASLRRNSLNRKLLTQAADTARRAGADVDQAEFAEFAMPLYDGDQQEADGIPAGAERLGRRIAASPGLMIVSPEYNHSIPGTLKNAIDWLSRIKPMPLRGKFALLLSASPGLVGGNRGLWTLRVPLEMLGVMIYPEMFSLAQADQAFDDGGGLKDPKTVARLEKLIGTYLEVGARLERAP